MFLRIAAFSLPRVTPARRAPVALLCALLSGCGAGGGGSQSPDPVVLDVPVAYISRARVIEVDGELQEFPPPALLEPTAFNPGAVLYLKDRATPTAASVNLSARIFEENALHDVRDLSVHPDGTRLLFAVRAPELPNTQDRDQPTWNIWVYDRRDDSLRRVIRSDIVAEAGQDLAPRYLPDGRILFISTRQSRSRAILLDDNKPQFAALAEDRRDPALLLHVMDDDGTGIEQIGFNQSHELQPVVLANGRILFSRWDRSGNRNHLSFYTLNPDGTDLQPHYGYRSLNGGNAPTLYRPEPLDDGRLLAVLRPRTNAQGGVLVAVDAERFTDEGIPVADRAGADEPSRVALLSGAPVTEFPDFSALATEGWYAHAFPMTDGSGRLLVSWSPCRLQDPETEQLLPCTPANQARDDLRPAPPLYGLWVYDPRTRTQQPLVVPEEGRLYTEAVTLAEAPFPCPYPAAQCPAPERHPDWHTQGVGVLHIRSVYDRDGEDTAPGGIAALADPAQTPPAERPVHFLRLIKPVSIPDRDTLAFDNSAFGVSAQQGMREILGYVPVHPDGSVMARVPADRAFTFELVDARGRRLDDRFPRHPSWLQLRPGEQRNCQGCHNPASQLPHGRMEAEPYPAYAGALGGFANTLREDAFGTPEWPDSGETMAAFDARVSVTCTDAADPGSCQPRGPAAPRVDLVFDDVWTDPAAATPGASFALRYQSLADDDYRDWEAADDDGDPPVLSVTELPALVSEDCQLDRSPQCRTVINYPWHIQPLWERPRYLTELVDGERVLVLDDNDQPVNRTCVTCHSRADAEGQPQVPAASLELTDTPGNQGRTTSYGHLLSARLELILEEGSLLPRQVETGEFQCAQPGLELDDPECELEPVLAPVTLPAPATVAGAFRSGRFFDRFVEGGSHQDFLNAHELRLISEWLDLGGQYFNNPFDAVDQD
ncbi:HzsA-related protein [Marinimicrobium alkaliphilum]|uniref:HzsA-related protein n=1 Tax=Marinimicrobium alkaliphilum TaxID=2202654 RepID=UPI000DBA3AF4|nr:hypothetical protein [Marinimicrobium alkaliphilum]